LNIEKIAKPNRHQFLPKTRLSTTCKNVALNGSTVRQMWSRNLLSKFLPWQGC